MDKYELLAIALVITWFVLFSFGLTHVLVHTILLIALGSYLLRMFKQVV